MKTTKTHPNEPPEAPGSEIPIQILAPDEYLGAVITELTSCSGTITNMGVKDGLMELSALLPRTEFDAFSQFVFAATFSRGIVSK